MIQPEKDKIETLAGYGRDTKMTAVEILNDDIYLGATEKLEIITIRRESGTGAEESRLLLVGQYQIGDRVNLFCHGSLVSVSDVSRISMITFSTNSGGIGLIASLPEDQFQFMGQLQTRLWQSINGNEEEWRLNYCKIEPADGSKFLDGDLIKAFLDWDISRKELISQQMKLSVEEIENTIREVTRLLGMVFLT